MDLNVAEYVFQTGLEPEQAREQLSGRTQEVIVSKSSTGYPEGLIDQVFAAPKNAVQKYESDEYDVLFEVRELTGADFSFETVYDAVLQDACRDDYAAYLKEAAYAAGLSFNEKALSRYKIQEVIQR